ncbi:MAG TPA: hypothetical protein VJ824_05960 [Bacillota bacterium]|nr:hypothetical protein [Bacillota bacterium]
MSVKNLVYASMLCLVCFTAAACSPTASDDRTHVQGIKGNHIYNNPSGPYDDDKGFKNDFQRSDLNPNMVTGQNDLFNLGADAKILAEMSTQVKGVSHAKAAINGGTAHVTIHVPNSTPENVAKIKSRVYNVLKMKFPRYNIDVNVR